MTIDRVRRGDRLSAAGQNEVIDRLNALTSPGAGDEAQYGTSGVTFRGAAATHFGVFELQETLTYPDLNDPTAAPTDHFDRDPCASANALMIWCNQQQDADQDSEGNPIRSYGASWRSKEVVVYHPTAFITPDYENGNPFGDGGYAYGTPSFSPGQRVYCIWNPQSCRWEILAPALNIWRVEMKSAYFGAAGEAECYLIDDQNYDSSDMSKSQVITVYRPDSHRVGVAKPATLSGNNQVAAGTLAYAVWSPVRQRFEFLSDQFKLVSEAKTYQSIANGASGLVNLWWLDPTSGNLVDSGLQVTAWNWLHPTIQSGEKVIVSYDRQEDRWIVLAWDYTLRPQSLDVVTSVWLSPSGSGYVVHYTTVNVQFPPWVTIGSPVTH